MPSTDEPPQMDWTFGPCSASCIAALCSSPTDESCICPDKRSGAPPWRRDLMECLYANCTSLEYYETAGITYHTCGISNTVELSLGPLIAITSAFQLLFFATRMASIRIKREREWSWEDISFVVSSVLLVLTLPVISLGT
ncbi:hypothetical protein J7T55_004229 [Diaporthe amygdali]|uniref:uncharacterized protein n=1 Tax=Phomopsis amygdali TaxID=1214568 RepID=UPI0022FECD46|nr:uncharacterized protein J7T55_004229 [Diaporthe amygdali]KAJ0103904.1 hypothetical protein J7T55_004229 [Diaporthe amygdali]